MKVGDLVWFAKPHNNLNLHGIIIEKMHDPLASGNLENPLASGNDVFKVLWNDGTIGNNVWDYDLWPLKGVLKGYYGKVINEDR